MCDNRASGGGLVEVATLTCAHCQQQVIRNPERERAREYCANCDRYICDACGQMKKAGVSCKTYNQILDELQAAAFRAEQAHKGTVYMPPVLAS